MSEETVIKSVSNVVRTAQNQAVNSSNDPKKQKISSETPKANQPKSDQDLVKITSEARQQNENPLNRKIQSISTNQDPRVRNEEKQFQPEQNAIGKRHEIEAKEVKQKDIKQLESKQNSSAVKGILQRDIKTNPTGIGDQPELLTPKSTQAEQEALQESAALGLGAEEKSAPFDRGPLVEDTKMNVQDTDKGLKQRQAQRDARELTVLPPPSQDLGSINLTSTINENPQSPGLEGSITEKVEKAVLNRSQGTEKFEAHKAARKQEKQNIVPDEPRNTENKGSENPTTTETQVGKQLDRLV